MPIDNGQALAGERSAGSEFAGSEDERKEKASKPILDQLRAAEKEFNEWDHTCHAIDEIYSRSGSSYEKVINIAGGGTWQDAELDLFWSSFEVMKPAVYAKSPIPAVAPLFKDNRPLHNTAAELLERASISAFALTQIDDVMRDVRDDLLFAGRGVMWLTYESKDGQKVCVEHKDRKDFLHEPARKWSEVGWVAGAAWLTREEMKERFKLSSDKLDLAKFTRKRDKGHDEDALTQKAQVWEVWHRANNRVYWVTEGIDTYLDDDTPHLKLAGFFPCPRPAYATLRRRSLVPVPDWERYAIHFRKISDLTARIYLLLDRVRMKGLIPAGGDVGEAIEQLMASDDDQMLVPVPGAAMLSDGATSFVAWLPLVELAQAIEGLIESRGQLINDFYELSGISDIMRGATEADETLGAQRLKSQYGSVRVRCKIDELQRVAADAVKIAAQIISDKFSEDTLLEMAQMQIPKKSEIEKRINEVSKAAEEEMKALGKQAEEQAAQAQGQVDPQQAKAMLAQAQQQIVQKYAPMLAEAESQISIEDVMKLLRDDRARSFAFEIESDSTILTDEIAEKQSRNEFVGAFTQASQALMGLAAMGEQGAALAGELMKFQLAPYRVGRQLDDAINAFIDAAPEMAAAMQGKGDEEGMGALAEAEEMKAQAQMERVNAQREADQGRNALAQAEMQRKMGEMAQKAQENERKAQAEAEKLRQSAEANATKAEEAMAKVDLLRAQTMKALAEAGVTVENQTLDEFKSLADIELRQNEQAMKVQDRAVDTAFRERGEQRADQQFVTEQQRPD